MFSATERLRNYMRNVVGPRHPLWSYYVSIREALDDILAGTSDPIDGDPFTVWKAIEGDTLVNQELALEFREEHAKEIGVWGAAISSLTEDLKDSLGS